MAPRVPTGMSPRAPAASVTAEGRSPAPPPAAGHESVTAVTAVQATPLDADAVDRARKELDELVRPLRERVAELTADIAALRRRVVDAEAGLERARGETRQAEERARAAASLIPVSLAPSAPPPGSDLTPFVPVVAGPPALPPDLTPAMPVARPPALPAPEPTPRMVDAAPVRVATASLPPAGEVPTIGFASVAPPVLRERAPSLVEIAAKAPVRADDVDLGDMLKAQRARALRGKIAIAIVVLSVLGLGAATILSRA